MNYSEKLRRFADWLDSKPELLESISDYESPSLPFYFGEKSKDQFAKLVRAIGDGEKSRYNDEISFRHDERDTESESESDNYWKPLVFSVYASISGVCEKKSTGKKKERTIYIPPNATQKEDGTWIVEDEVFEYECPPLLSLASSEDD